MKYLFRMFKYVILPSFLLLIFNPTYALENELNNIENFAYGSDIGWIKQLQDEGVTWQNDNGEASDPLLILKDHGINSVRLRVFVNPDPTAYWHKNNKTWTMLGYTDKVRVIEAANRAQQLGMRVMVDFHYSDVFADPAIQYKPAAWVGMSIDQLVVAISNHTRDVMSDLIAEGVTPEWVQVGNEIDNGILLPEGSPNNFAHLTSMLNAGYDAVKAISPSSKVITHLSKGTDNSKSRWFFDNFLTTHGGKTDIIGFSFYPYWLGQDYWNVMDALSKNLNDMAARYNKEVMVVETGGAESNPTDSYWTVKETIKAVKAVPNNKGLGVFYWEPTANSSVLPDGYSLGATKKIDDKILKFTIALDAFNDALLPPVQTEHYRIINRNSGKALNVRGGSVLDAANIEQYDYDGWLSQHFTLVELDNGYYHIVNVRSKKHFDIDSNSTNDGAQAVQMTATEQHSQQWTLQQIDGTYYKIVNRHNAKLLDINQASTQDGATAIQWPDNGGWNQHWQIIKN